MRSAAPAEDRQCDRQDKKQRAEDGSRSGKQIRGAAPPHEGAHALGRAYAETTALAPLQQDNPDESKGHEQVDDEQDTGHGREF